MYGAIAYEVLETVGVAAPVWNVRVQNLTSKNAPSMPNQHEGTTMELATEKKSRTGLADNTPNSSADADVIFIKEWAQRYPSKKGGKLAGMTPKGFQKVQSGDNAISYKKLTRWLKSDPDFAAAYAAHIGLILPGEAESASAFTRAVNAFQRRQG